jgi:GH24 family phage-related lysozyme (muramidase)
MAFDPYNPDVSPEGVAFTCGWEGWVDHRYRDPIGLWTIGYGHLIKAGENFPPTITHDFGLNLLHTDMQKCVRAIVAAVHPEVLALFTDHMFDALCDWLFNCGPGAIGVSILLKHINSGHFEYVPDDLCQWCKVTVYGVKQTHPGLLARRRREGELWTTPGVQCPIGVACDTRGVVADIPDADREEYARQGIVILQRHAWELVDAAEHDLGNEDPH